VSRLQFPLREGLRDPADEAALARIWTGIDARFPRRRRPRTGIVLASALALSGAVAAGVVLSRRDPGPLRFADGRPVAAVDAPAEGAVMSLSDGSYIELGGGARLEPVESSGTQFVAVLARGNAGFEVRPGGPRRWRIECGLATVEVVGTHFSCERSPGRLRVAVQRGAVLVSGERVPDRVRRVAAGDSLEVGERPAVDFQGMAPAPTTGVLPAPSVAAPTSAEAPADQPPAAAGREPPPRAAAAGGATSWRELARLGRHEEAFAALGPHGIRREAKRLGVADLLALADVARLSGHPADAEAPLEAILSDHAADPQAPLAAFALGRLELDSLGRPARAATAFRRALALGIPQSLREDLRARLVEAYLRAGDPAAARSAARDYEREFPGGRYAKTIESRIAEP
jgi:transmembrane sensor